MDKLLLDQKIIDWLRKYISRNLKGYGLVQITTPDHVLSKLSDPMFKTVKNISSWDFQPDILAIVKKNDNLEFLIVTRHIGGFGLKELGEINCYTRIMRPLKSFVVSTSGVSTELAIMLLDESIRKRLLTHTDFQNEINILIYNKTTESFDLTY